MEDTIHAIEVYPIDKRKESITMIYADELNILIKQVYKGEVNIEKEFFRIKEEIYTRHDVIKNEQSFEDMHHLECVLDDLCHLGHLEEGIYYISQE